MQRRNYVRKPGQLIPVLIAFLLLPYLTPLSALTEDEEKPSLNTGTIEQQFDFMVDKSSNYEDYKVIKKSWVYTRVRISPIR